MGVEFEENNFQRRVYSEKVPKFAGWLIEKGLAKDVSGANKIQILLAIVFFVLAILFAL